MRLLDEVGVEMKATDRPKDIQRRLKELHKYHGDAGCIDMEHRPPRCQCRTEEDA